MSTVRYELKSIPGAFIDVPGSYARIAESLVHRALEGPRELPRLPNDGIYMGSMALWATAGTLAQSPGFAPLQDKVYLMACQARGRQDSSGPKNPRRDELDAALVKLLAGLDCLES